MTKLLALSIVLLRRIRRRIKISMLRPAFKKTGKNFIFDPDGDYSFDTIEVGDDVYIGPGAILQAPLSSIMIGDKVLFGPNVTIIGGNHNSSVVGEFMFDVHEKKQNDDLPVIIESDVWIGAGSIILKGVTVGRGSVVAAGSLVNKNIPPYSVCAGTPTKIVRLRWCPDTIRQHEAMLYHPESRLSEEAMSELESLDKAKGVPD